MKTCSLISSIILLNMFFHFSLIVVDGQVALSRHWLRGKFSDRKAEMDLMKAAESDPILNREYSVGFSNPLPDSSDQDLNSDSAKDKRWFQPSFLATIHEASKVSLTGHDQREQKRKDDNNTEKHKEQYNSFERDRSDSKDSSEETLTTPGMERKAKLCRQIFIEAMDSRSKATKNSCYCFYNSLQ